MATVAEKLITVYELHDRQHQAAASRMIARNRSIGQSADEAQARVEKIGSRIGSAIGGGVVAVAGLAAGLAGAGIAAANAAAKFDTMERTFAGAFGSVEAGAQVMEGLERYATRSAFSLEALANASKMLAAGGLSLNKYLPVIERYALVASGVDPEGLERVAAALLRAKGGSFGEAMEAFRRSGVSSTEIASAAGRPLTKGGEFTGSPEQFLQAVASVSEGRLKQIADSVAGGAETKISNAGDVTARAFRMVGSELLDVMLPRVERFTSEFSELVDSGRFKQLAEGIGQSVDRLFGGSDGTSFASALEQGAISVTRFIDALGTIGQGVSGAASGAGDFWNTIVKAASGIPLIGGAIGSVNQIGEMLFGPGGLPAGLAATYGGSSIAPAGMAPSKSRVAAFPEQAAVASPVVEAIREGNEGIRQMVNLQQKQIDIQRSILGGGTVGASSLSPVRVGQMLNGRPGANNLEKSMMQLVDEVMKLAYGASPTLQRMGR